ncbi:transcriptional regulator [Subtercola boreus]|uniref:Transcriptional regulator n=1 Tax=Subtercola boreus TaxID=120213 RepID=A0A3E0VQT3_9MICO|nr:helix-turn-helix domain-containing protein [Subtercola boreus]RFA11818.1 transcriptional regulator [Subtercola boreus]
MTPQLAARLEDNDHYDVYDPGCPSRAVLDHVTSRWGVLVLAALRDGTLRFSALRRRVGGVSEKMLSQTLRNLESDGFVTRHDHRSAPPHVDYTLTPTGEEIANLLTQLVTWVENHVPPPTQ